jgi:hypothetical protein
MQPPTIIINFVTPGLKKAAESTDPDDIGKRNESAIIDGGRLTKG